MYKDVRDMIGYFLYFLKEPIIMCFFILGSKLGLIHVKVVLAMILNEYELYTKPDTQAKFDPRATFTVADQGLNIEFRKLPVDH